MSQRPRRYRTERRACVDLSARVDPKTGKVRSAEFEEAANENDPISHDSFPPLEQWDDQMVYCPKCFNCFTFDSYAKCERMYTTMGRKLHCPLCNEEIDEMHAYGWPIIPKEEENRQSDEIKCYNGFMWNALFGMRTCMPRARYEEWWPELEEKIRKDIDRGRKDMMDAYQAGNPGGSYFEARNRRWREYYENVVRPAEEQDTTCRTDLVMMYRKRDRIETDPIIPDEDKEDILNQMDETIRYLKEQHEVVKEFWVACRERVNRKVLSEAQE